MTKKTTCVEVATLEELEFAAGGRGFGEWVSGNSSWGKGVDIVVGAVPFVGTINGIFDLGESGYRAYQEGGWSGVFRSGEVWGAAASLATGFGVVKGLESLAGHRLGGAARAAADHLGGVTGTVGQIATEKAVDHLVERLDRAENYRLEQEAVDKAMAELDAERAQDEADRAENYRLEQEELDKVMAEREAEQAQDEADRAENYRLEQEAIDKAMAELDAQPQQDLDGANRFDGGNGGLDGGGGGLDGGGSGGFGDG